jgi:hypothetical protein
MWLSRQLRDAVKAVSCQLSAEVSTWLRDSLNSILITKGKSSSSRYSTSYLIFQRLEKGHITVISTLIRHLISTPPMSHSTSQCPTRVTLASRVLRSSRSVMVASRNVTVFGTQCHARVTSDIWESRTENRGRESRIRRIENQIESRKL